MLIKSKSVHAEFVLNIKICLEFILEKLQLPLKESGLSDPQIRLV